MTQRDMILDYIEEYGSITSLEAIRDLGCMRLASRISELKKKGYNIVSERIKVPNRRGEWTPIARYRMGE